MRALPHLVRSTKLRVSFGSSRRLLRAGEPGASFTQQESLGAGAKWDEGGNRDQQGAHEPNIELLIKGREQRGKQV